MTLVRARNGCPLFACGCGKQGKPKPGGLGASITRVLNGVLQAPFMNPRTMPLRGPWDTFGPVKTSAVGRLVVKTGQAETPLTGEQLLYEAAHVHWVPRGWGN